MTPPDRSQSGAGPRVLCVDDEAMIGEVVSRILESQLGCNVHQAASGEEALARIAATNYDAIIVDYIMPNMDGGELYGRLLDRHPEMIPRLLFTTGDTLSPRTLEFIADSGRPLLEKPFGLPELTQAVREVLPRTAPRRESIAGEAGRREVGQHPARSAI